MNKAFGKRRSVLPEYIVAALLWDDAGRVFTSSFRLANLARQPHCFNCEIWNLHSEILHVHLAKLQSKVFSVGSRIPQPVGFLFVVTKAATEEGDKKKIQEVTVSQAAAKEISVISH